MSEILKILYEKEPRNRSYKEFSFSLPIGGLTQPDFTFMLVVRTEAQARSGLIGPTLSRIMPVPVKNAT